MSDHNKRFRTPGDLEKSDYYQNQIALRNQVGAAVFIHCKTESDFDQASKAIRTLAITQLGQSIDELAKRDPFGFALAHEKHK